MFDNLVWTEQKRPSNACSDMLTLKRPGLIASATPWLGGVMVLVWMLTVPSLPAHAQQNEEDLRAQRASTEQRLQQLEKQIQREKNRLQQTREQQQTTQKKLTSLRREIALREELVSTYQTRLNQLERERRHLRDTLSTLQTRLNTLREEYQRRLVHAYKYGRLHDLALLLASQSINQMLIRARYLRRFAADRRAQRGAIRTATQELRQSRERLAKKRAETRELLIDARTERENLRALERDRRQVIQELRSRESKIKKQLEQKRQQAKQLEQRIQELIARAQRNDTGESPESQPGRSAAFANLSASFRKNRGQLPWPTDGVVTVEFGNQVDPTYQTSTYHPGIRIATNPANQVHAVFDGTVAGINFVAGYGTYVVIRHGDYLSVYSNFSSLAITEGEQVNAGQLIGRSGTEDEPLGASLFFGVVNRSSSDFVDPIGWLSAR